MATAGSERAKEIWSWIHNEQKCITTRYIAIYYQIPRVEASNILSSIVGLSDTNPENKYEKIESIVTKNEKGRSVVKLQKSIISKNLESFASEGVIYSLCLLQNQNEAPSNSNLISAHEHDMVYTRQLVLKENQNIFQHIKPTIKPSVSIKFTSTIAEVAEKSTGTSEKVADPPKEISTQKFTKKSIVSKSKSKTTSAASFFAKNSKPKAKSSKSKTSNLTETNEELDNEKKNSRPKDSTRKVGNADDFVGDMDDESDDEEPQVKASKTLTRPPRSKKRKAVVEAEPEEIEAVEDIDDGPVRYDDEPVENGAMDKFVVEKDRKRRKRLVEKTSMDKNGYILTETVQVWEEVSEEQLKKEEEERAKKKEKLTNNKPLTATTKSKKFQPPKTKNMKQGSLMGFFKKK